MMKIQNCIAESMEKRQFCQEFNEMSQELILTGTRKEEMYRQLLPQIQNLLKGEKDAVANMANTCAALQQAFKFLWVGFYRVIDNELVLGPFQGPIACTRIAFGKGVCGTAWKEKKSILVPDVHVFPGHIACSSLSNSEVVVPIMKNQEVIAVLDIDSERKNDFDETDLTYLEELCTWLSGTL
jgi:L-methionine (R)-S-oxide reductase